MLTQKNFIEEPKTQYYFNNTSGLICFASEQMIQKLAENESLFFTVSINDFKELLKLAIEKDSGKSFEGCKPFFIPNSYIEIHVHENISMFADKVILQIRKRTDDRGINIFVQGSQNEVSHNIVFNDFSEKEEYYNELHLKTKNYNNIFTISICPI